LGTPSSLPLPHVAAIGTSPEPRNQHRHWRIICRARARKGEGIQRQDAAILSRGQKTLEKCWEYLRLTSDIRRAGHSLVGGIPTPLKNMKANGKDDIPYIMGKNMFETTSQE